jgi:cell division protein FtsZ
MSINLHLPSHQETLRPTITVIGVGGAGGNAVNNMISAQLEGVEFVVANTDAQALDNSLTNRVIQLGANLTRGLGAGADPQVGAHAAEEALEEISSHIQGSNMVFITAGMGGGTGTGAAPVVAKAARDMGILTVGVVTKPFQFEGNTRMRMAEEGLRNLQQYVDTLIVIPNQNLFRLANERTTFADAFRMADEVLHSGVRGVTDLMVKPGLVNLDFADIRAVMREMGKAMMGTGEATGEKRAIEAAESAISNPLLDDVSLKGARAALINITGGSDMTLFEVDEAANRIREEIDPEANIIFGSTFSNEMDGRMRVSVVATGIDVESMQASQNNGGSKTVGSRPFSYASSQPAQNRPVAVEAQKTPVVTKDTRGQSINIFGASARRFAVPSEQQQHDTHDEKAQQDAEAVHEHSHASQQPQMQPKEMRSSTGRAHTVSVETVKQAEDEATVTAEARRVRTETHAQHQQAREQATEKSQGSLFVSPPAERPVSPQRGYQTPYSNPNARTVREQDTGESQESFEEERAETEPYQQEGASRGLLGRLAEVAHSLSGNNRNDVDDAQRRATAAPRKAESHSGPRVEIASNAQEKAVEAENYDIPAFLRRQAN